MYLIFHTLFFPPISIYAQTQGFEKKENSYTDSLKAPAAVDSTLITLIGLFKKEKFIVNLKDGSTYKGKIKIRENGIEVNSRDIKSLTDIKTKTSLISWDKIQTVQVIPRKSKLFIINVATAVIMGIFIIYSASGQFIT